MKNGDLNTVTFSWQLLAIYLAQQLDLYGIKLKPILAGFK